MFEMTTEELSLYGEKKRVLKEFSEMFFKDIANDYCRPVGSRIYEKFTLKEIVSDDFLYTFYPYIQKYTGTALYGIFQRFYSKKMFNLTKEESNMLLPLVIELFSDYKEGVSFPSAITIFRGIMNNNINDEELINLLFEHDYFKKSRISTRSDYVLSFINDIVGKGKFEDAEAMIKTIESSFPDYHNFPIIIMNKNISKEEKIKALKLIYRKKDFPQYKLYFRQNLTDLDDLDTFIEATIIQNNRVREKDDNLIKLFKDIFISGEWRENLFANKTYAHLKEFSKKYSKYFFNPDFARRFYNDNVSSLSTNEHTRQEQYESFIKAIFSALTTEEKIEAMTKSKELESLGSNFSQTFKDTLASGEDDELCRKLIGVFETWSRDKRERFFDEIGRENIIEVFEKFGKDLTIVKELKLFDYGCSVEKVMSAVLDSPGYSSYYNVEENIMKSLFNKDVFNNVKFFAPGDWECLGFNYAKAKERITRKSKYWNDTTTVNMFIPVEICMRSFFSNISRISETDDYELMEQIIERFFVTFEESTDILAENAMYIYNDDVLKSYTTRSGYYRNKFNVNNKTHVIESVKTVIDKAIDAATDVYGALGKVKPEYKERFDILKENLSDTKGTIDLICAI